jgi:hypothetical protein
MSRSPRLLAAGALLLVPDPAFAQDRSISVYFEACEVQQLNNAIAAALTQPPFLLLTTSTPGALVVTVPDRVTADHTTRGTNWTFTVAFRRNGDSLGQSVESCNEYKLSDCTDQLVSDVKSAAGMGP